MKKIVVVSIVSRDNSEKNCNQLYERFTYTLITIWNYLR
jgi:hypothetical protein